ncbi:MAG: hypothetical protein BWY79_01924 [Actinobacteria bacterium ADurb.Bin444]|nr:MAG: hypothetical protein BWY79_01924 [Actinobacteria bacterium ADurb.Bin444]
MTLGLTKGGERQTEGCLVREPFLEKEQRPNQSGVLVGCEVDIGQPVIPPGDVVGLGFTQAGVAHALYHQPNGLQVLAVVEETLLEGLVGQTRIPFDRFPHLVRAHRAPGVQE